MKSKGLSTTTIQILTALLTLGLVAVFWFLILGYFVDLEGSVQSAEIERQNLNLAQVLISSQRLAYFDGHRVQRGIIDWDKALDQLVEGSDLLDEVGYPNTMMAVYVKNLDSGEQISVAYWGPITITSVAASNPVTDFFTCLKPKIGWDMMFRIPPGSPWYPSDVAACSGSVETKYGTEVRTFPISIRLDDGTVDQGILRVTIMEVF